MVEFMREEEVATILYPICCTMFSLTISFATYEGNSVSPAICQLRYIFLPLDIKAAFPRAKFLCHISHALQSLLTYFCGIVTVNLY